MIEPKWLKNLCGQEQLLTHHYAFGQTHFLDFKLANFCPVSVGNQVYILPNLRSYRPQTVSYIKGTNRLAMQSGEEYKFW